MKNTSLIRLKLVLSLLVFVFASSASAVTIDFESLQHVDNGFPNHGVSYSEDGFTVTSNSGNGFNSRGTLDPLFTGSTAIYNNRVNGITTLTQDNGNPFAILSIDLAELNAVAGVPVAFTGTLAGGGTVTQSFLLDNVFASAQTFFFNGMFGNLASLSWVQAPNFHSFDNLVVNAVPVPAAFWLFGSALLGFAGFSRRRIIA